MKITELKIRNFKNIESMDIDIKNINIILGDCGSGKTSILNALNFALTGEIDVTDIRNDADLASVTVCFEDGSTIRRERDKDGTIVRVNGKKSTAKAAGEYLNTILGFDPAVLQSLIGINFFGLISKRDLTDFFTKVLPCSIDFDKMIELISSKYTISKKTIDYLKTLFPDNSYNLSTIDAAYKNAFNERKVKKSYLATLSKIDTANLTKPIETKEELKKSLFAIAEQESKFKSYEKEMLNYNNSVKAKNEAEIKINALKDELVKMTSIIAPDESILNQAKEDRKKFEDAIARSQSLKATADANIVSFNNILKSLEGDRCVACKDIVCTTDKSCAKGELEARIKDNERVKKEHEDFIIRCKEQIDKRDKIIDAYNENALQYTKKASLEKQIAEFVFPVILPKPEEIVIKNFDEEKAVIDNKLGILLKFEMAEKCDEERVKAQEEVSMLEEAVLVLDVKTGVRTLILQRALQTFETVCNNKATQLDASIKMRFEAKEGIEVFVETKNSNGFIPMEKISTGQMIIVSYILMCLVSEVTKGKYAVIDNLDSLDKTYAKSFVNLISKDDTFDNIFIAGVGHEEIKKACEGQNIIFM